MTEIKPFDDQRILKDDDLYRRIPPREFNDEENRPIPGAFKDIYLSVNVSKLTTPQKTMGPVKHFSNFRNWRLASFKAFIPREEGLWVYMSPAKKNPAHAIVWGEKSFRVRRKLAQACEWIEWKANDT